MKALVEHFHVADGIESLRVRVDLGIRVVDAVDLRGLHEAIDIELARAQRSGGVGREVRVAGTCGENDDAALLHVADGATPDVGLGNFLHVDGALHAGEHAVALEGILQGERVHDRSEHADVVGLRAIHALRRARNAAEDVAAAHNDSELDTVVHDFRDFVGQVIDHLRIDPVTQIAGERLAGKLQKHTLVLVLVGHRNPFFCV